MKASPRVCRIENALRKTRGLSLLAGVDEVGVGAWAGPLVACSVLVPPGFYIPGLDDSKRLSAAQRERLAEIIRETALAVSIALVTADEIDRSNVLFADMLAMQRAVAQLDPSPQLVLIDGRRAPLLSYPVITLVKGDHRCASVAAASIVAKVWRDKLMTELAEQYPLYGWERNKGYGTRSHQQAIAQHGPTPKHRHSYRPIRLCGAPKLFCDEDYHAQE